MQKQDNTAQSMRKQPSICLSKLKSFNDAVSIAVIAANRPCEDRHSVVEFAADNTLSSQTNKSSALVCSVFDGHGGYQIAQYLENWIKTYFQEVYDPYESETSAVEAIRYAYERAEQNLWD